ncbi:MAG TPA: ATP synthase F0 subunit C [Thermoanaerobaculia bacterium]|nr:ATP synthase F0 subunit C [Thermoanaerobaculia bacterium]
MKILKITLFVALLALSASAMFAQGAATAPAGSAIRWDLVAATVGLAIAASAGAIGQSRAIAAALEGMARNPGAGRAIQTAMIIGLALIESLVIYVLVVAFIIVFK